MANTKVTSGVIKDDAVGADQLASNSVVTASINDNAITTAKIADDAILTAKISNSAITNAKMSSNSVDSDQYVDASIDTAHIRDGQVTSAKLDTNIAVSGTLNVTGVTTLATHLVLGDDDIIKIGAGDDMHLFHSSSVNQLQVDQELKIQKKTGPANMIIATPDGAVELYYAGSKKIETASGGVTVTGTLTADDLEIDSGTLSVDASNNRVGIGTASPDTIIEIVSADPVLTVRDSSTSSSDANSTLRLAESGASDALGVHYDIALDNLALKFGYSNDGSAATERMRIDSSGNVGIGLTNQANKLQVDGDICIGKATTTADLKSTLKMRGANGSNELQVFDLINDGENGRVDFAYNRAGSSAQTIMTFGATVGNVGIGTTSPAAPLHVIGNDGVQFNRSGQTNGFIIRPNASTDGIRFTQGGTGDRMTIDSSGNLLVGATSTNTGGFGSVSPQLQVAGSMPQVLLHETDTDKDGYIGISGSTMFIQTADAIPIRFGTSDAERMRIASNGSIGFGTTPPTDTHTVWTQLFAGTRASLISENTTGAGGLDGTWLTDNMYVDSDTGAFANITTDESSAINQNGGEIKFFSQASGSAGAGITLSEKMRIASDGNVGIGSSAPDKLLTVQGADAEIAISDTNDTPLLRFRESGTTKATIRTVSGALAFDAGGATERMRITSGKLAIGTTGLNNSFVSTGIDIEAGTSPAITMNRNSDGDIITFKKDNGTGTVGRISITSSSTAYNTSSDARLKNVLGEAKGLEIINKLNPVNFEWKESKEIQDGLIAQEVMDIVPNAVTGSEEDYYQMDYSKLVTPLIKAIQEQQTQIDALQSEINELKNS